MSDLFDRRSDDAGLPNDDLPADADIDTRRAIEQAAAEDQDTSRPERPTIDVASGTTGFQGAASEMPQRPFDEER